MADTITNDTTSPTKYVTILDLREQWLKKQQQQQEQEEVANRVKEKVQGAGDAGLDEKPQFQNPTNLTRETKTHKSEIGEIKFRRNPNWNNRRPFRRNLDGENQFVKKVNDSRVEAPGIVDGVKVAAKMDAPQKLKASKGFGAVDVKNTTQETTEIEVGTVVEAESDALGQVKDAQTVKDEQKRLNNRMRKKRWRERWRNRRIAEKEGQIKILVSEDHFVMEKGKCGECKEKKTAKMKDVSVVEERNLLKEKLNVSKNGECGEKTVVGDNNQECLNDLAAEIEGKLKEILLLEEQIPATEKQNEHVNEEFGGNVSKNGEMRRGDHRARAERKFGGSVRGRWNRGEGGRRMSGLIWVKKSEVSG